MSPSFLRFNISQLYDRFDSPITEFDCGLKCAPYNANGIPVCFDICQAVPVAYHQEWDYLQQNTDLWHVWRGDECLQEPCNPADLRSEVPDHMLMLACQGPAHCQREFRTFSCRQFPFFPYITSDDRFLGLAYTWDFESTCWIISHLEAVTDRYRQEFILLYDQVLAQWDDDFESYANLSAEMREHFAAKKRRIPLLHRNNGYYLISQLSERLRRVPAGTFRRFGPFKRQWAVVS